EGGRQGFGAAHLGGYDRGRLVYAGRVGSGFADAELRTLRKRLEADALPEPPVSLPPLIPRGSVWVRPKVGCEGRYKEVTEEGVLRAPVFVRLRDDKSPEECGLPGKEEPEAPKAAPVAAAQNPGLKLSRLDKVFWPDEGYTKGDLISYYRDVAPWLLVYLRDR